MLIFREIGQISQKFIFFFYQIGCLGISLNVSQLFLMKKLYSKVKIPKIAILSQDKYLCGKKYCFQIILFPYNEGINSAL